MPIQPDDDDNVGSKNGRLLAERKVIYSYSERTDELFYEWASSRAPITQIDISTSQSLGLGWRLLFKPSIRIVVHEHIRYIRRAVEREVEAGKLEFSFRSAAGCRFV